MNLRSAVAPAHATASTSTAFPSSEGKSGVGGAEHYRPSVYTDADRLNRYAFLNERCTPFGFIEARFISEAAGFLAEILFPEARQIFYAVDQTQPCALLIVNHRRLIIRPAGQFRESDVLPISALLSKEVCRKGAMERVVVTPKWRDRHD